MKNSSILRRCFVLTFFFCCLAVRFSFGWGTRAHEIINRVAFERLPGHLPAFLQTRQALDEIEYLGPEPDRWRSHAEPELSIAQAPEHFLDLEPADLAAPDGLPAERFDFLRDLDRAQQKYPRLAAELTPQKVGLLPWKVDELFERLRLDMRDYRTCLASHQPTYGVQQTILYDAGVLGHYVADGSQPLHTTVDHNGWVGTKNPEGFTRNHQIHGQFETEFVEANIRAENIRPLVPASARVLDAPFQDFVNYLRASHRQVRELYRLERDGGFNGRGTAQSRGFVAERMAAGATMLRDMVYTAWVQSADPRPHRPDRSHEEQSY